MSTETGVVTNLTNSPGLNESDAAWSPDGTRIAYELHGLSSTDIYVINVDGTGAVRLTNEPGFDHIEPAWSPDGLQIVFRLGFWLELDPTLSGLYVMNADGSGRVRLNSDRTALYPDW